MIEDFLQEKETTDETSEKIVRMDNNIADERIRTTVDINAIKEEIREETQISTRRSKYVEALARLIIELEDKLADYDTIISDEASGRLPSNFLRLIINKERKKKGKPPVKLSYIVGGNYNEERTDEAIKKFLESKKDLGKVLLSTEHIQSGRGMLKFIEIMENLGIDFDISAVSVTDDPYDSQTYSKGISSRLYFGSVGSAGVEFFGKLSLRRPGLRREQEQHK